MNYIKQIKALWLSNEENSFTPTEISLYFYLLEVCNLCQWKNPFKRNNAKIEADLSISYKTLKNARNSLKQAGIIDFSTKNGSPNTSYFLATFGNLDEVRDEVRDEINKTKTKLKTNSKELVKGKSFFPPTQNEVEVYFISEKKIPESDAVYFSQRFVDFYTSKNWYVGKNKMSNWKSAATRSLEWEDRRKQHYKHPAASYSNKESDIDERIGK